LVTNKKDTSNIAESKTERMTTGHIVVFTIGVIKTKKRYIIKHG
jgi:hypothetical protein